MKVHRQLLSWEWFSDSKTTHLFLTLLLMANHTPHKWKGHQIKRGQLVTGRRQLSAITGISEQSIRTCFAHLKSTSEITIKSTNKFSIITICNYEKYQGSENEINQQINQQANHQLTTLKEYNNKKNKKSRAKAQKTDPDLFEQFWKKYPNKKNKKRTRVLFGKLDLSNGLFQKIMTGLEQYKKSDQWQRDNGQFIPHPSTWINQERWDDEVDTREESKWI